MIEAALEPVLADVRATGAPIPLVAAANWDPELQSTVMLLREDGSGAGVGVLRRSSRSDQVVRAAEGVQEWVVETLWSLRRATNWPRCPAHPDTHPMTPVLVDDVPTWRCPVSPATHARIGSLGSAPPRR